MKDGRNEMRDSKRLDDMVERIGRLERRAEHHESQMTVLLQGLTTWMNGINEATAADNERMKTVVADLNELVQHVRGKLDL